MKILMLIDTLNIGGAETHLCSLCEHLKAKGHEVVVASEGGIMLEKLYNVGIKHIILPSYAPIFTSFSHAKGISPSPLATSIKALVHIARAEKPNLIHAHTRKTSFIADLVCKRLDIPLVTTAHAMFSMKGYKGAMSRWGDGTIAVSEDIARHIVRHSLIKPKRLCVIRNGVSLPLGQ